MLDHLATVLSALPGIRISKIDGNVRYCLDVVLIVVELYRGLSFRASNMTVRHPLWKS